jgi:uncharacterized protein (TIGR00288 family)
VSNEELIAVFIDYENLAIGVRGIDDGRLDIGLVLKRLLEKGRIVYKRAYCDWGHYRPAVEPLHKQGVVMVDIPQSKMSGKNSADIHMVVDAMDLCFAKEHIHTFALLSGDSDFSPLVSKLKENDKRVIGCGVKNSTSNLLVASCDEFIYYDDLVRRAAKAAKATSRPKKGKKSSAEDKKVEAVDLLLEIVRSLSHDYENVWGSMVKQTMGRVHPGFNPAYHGYESFNALLRVAEKRGLLGLEHDRARGNPLIRLADS